MVRESNRMNINEMLKLYAEECSMGEKGKSIRWLQNSLPWKHLNLQVELPQFRKSMSGSFDGSYSESSVKEKFKKLQSVIPLDSIIELSESSIGEPVSFKISTNRGDEVNVDGNDLSLIYFATRIDAFWRATHKEPPTRILDIGGGYGGLVGKLAKLYPSARISLIDTPEGNLLQTFYLSKLFPDSATAVTNRSLETPNRFDAKFSIIPIRQFDLLFNFDWDLIINTRSMQEMDPEDIASYFDLIQKKLRNCGLFYNANQLTGGAAGTPYNISRSPYDDNWALLSANPSFLQADNFEICSLRLNFKNEVFRRYLKSLPTTNIWRTGLWSYRHKPLMLVDQLGASLIPKLWLSLKKTTRFFRRKTMRQKYNEIHLLDAIENGERTVTASGALLRETVAGE
jgi:putative sugar O-methyltransferase